MLAESAATRDAAAVRPQTDLPVFPFTVRHSVLPGEHGQRDSQACSGSSASSQAERDALRKVARRARMEIAVVTGTSTGIGFATSLRLARHGYRVFAGMRNLGKAEPLRAAAAEARLPVEVIPLDVTSTPSVQRAFETVAANGPVDVLVNNAGIGGATPLELTPQDEHRAMFETNYFGAIRCIQAVLPAMRERRRGTIVHVTSIAGLVSIPNQLPYSASKWALEGAGEALAHEMVRFGIRVVHVEPGVVKTNIFD